MNPESDADLRALLHETADQITPRGSLDDILARTAATPRRHWALPMLAAAAAMALVVGGIGWMLQRDDGGGSTNVATQPTVTRASQVFYAGETRGGPRLFAETTELTATDNDTGFATEAANAVLAGQPADPDYTGLWPEGVRILSVGSSASDPDTITITFSGDSDLNRPAGMSDEGARLALESMVRSVGSALGREVKVTFQVEPGDDGAHTDPVEILGLPLNGPVGTTDDDTVMAPVQITNLTNGQVVPAGTVKVEGVAAAFEANVVWEVLVGGDAVVKQDFTTAAECCTLSPYSFTVDLEPGTYTIVVHDSDASGGEGGGGVNQDTKEIVVE